MRFPRQARIFRGQFDVAPYAGVLFLLVLFLLLHSSLVFRPGVKIDLPLADELPGPDRPAVVVAIDPNGLLYYENQIIQEPQLKERLSNVVLRSGQPMTLVLQADGKVTQSQVVRLGEMARAAGIRELWLATRPRGFEPPPTPASSPAAAR